MADTEQTTDPTTPGAAVQRKRIYVTSAQIAAARLQITLDRKFGRTTQEIVKKIAAAK